MIENNLLNQINKANEGIKKLIIVLASNRFKDIKNNFMLKCGICLIHFDTDVDICEKNFDESLFLANNVSYYIYDTLDDCMKTSVITDLKRTENIIKNDITTKGIHMLSFDGILDNSFNAQDQLCKDGYCYTVFTYDEDKDYMSTFVLFSNYEKAKSYFDKKTKKFKTEKNTQKVVVRTNEDKSKGCAFALVEINPKNIDPFSVFDEYDLSKAN